MVKSFFEHVAEQYPNEIKRSKYEYWRKLKRAHIDFESDSVKTEGEFVEWMRERWGLAIEMIDGGYSPYYNIVDEKKYLLFTLKYG